MNKTSLLVCSSFAALFLATGANAQSERQSPNAGDAAPSAKDMGPSGAGMPDSRAGSGASGAERGSRVEGSDRTGRPEANDRRGSGKKAGDAARSDNEGASTGASEGTAGHDNATRYDKSPKRSKEVEGDKSQKNNDASSGASEGTAGNESKPAGSITELSGEKRTKVQSAFRSHKSGAVVKDIDINIGVGVAVPRSVTLYAVPEDVVVIVPEYRRYKYFVYDDRVVIVDPDTFAIVDILILA